MLTVNGKPDERESQCDFLLPTKLPLHCGTMLGTPLHHCTNLVRSRDACRCLCNWPSLCGNINKPRTLAKLLQGCSGGGQGWWQRMSFGCSDNLVPFNSLKIGSWVSMCLPSQRTNCLYQHLLWTRTLFGGGCGRNTCPIYEWWCCFQTNRVCSVFTAMIYISQSATLTWS